MTNKIDLSSLDTVAGANKGFDVKIYHPGTLADLGITITVLGKDSDEFLKVSRKQQKKRIDRLQKGGFRGISGLSAEETEKDGIELLASCTMGWIGVVLEGEDLPFSHENAVEVYTRFPWIKEQVDTAIGDRSNFLEV